MDDIFFHLAHIFRTQSVFSNSKHYLEIINFLNLNQEPTDFGKKFQIQMKKKLKIELFC